MDNIVSAHTSEQCFKLLASLKDFKINFVVEEDRIKFFDDVVYYNENIIGIWLNDDFKGFVRNYDLNNDNINFFHSLNGRFEESGLIIENNDFSVIYYPNRGPRKELGFYKNNKLDGLWIYKFIKCDEIISYSFYKDGVLEELIREGGFVPLNH